MASTLVFGEKITVLAALGFIVREFTLDSSTLDGDDVLDGTLEGVDISPYVQSLSINRGRSDAFSSFRAGTCSVVLNNNDRRFDPINQSSPYWDVTTNKSGVAPRRRFEVLSGSTPLFTGRITDIDVEYSFDLSTVTIIAADDFVLIANAFTGAPFTPSVELSGTRVTNILDRPEINYPSTTRNIDAGVASLGAYQVDANTNAGGYLQRVAQSEQGLFFCAANGDLTFTDRVASVFATSAATFADDGTGIKYQGIDTIYDQKFLFNRVQATVEGGTVQAVDDATSQTEFGIATLSLDNLLLGTNAEALTLATQLLDTYKDPQYRFDNIRLMVSALSDPNRDTVLALEMGDVITVTRTFATGTPASVSDDYGVERIVHQITPDRHMVTLGLYVANLVFPLILNDVVFGILDADNALT